MVFRSCFEKTTTQIWFRILNVPEPVRIPFIRPYFPKSALSADSLEFWVGREAEVDRVVRGLLAAPAHYLITGYSGVGKSSFVSRVIADWRNLCSERGIDRLLIFNLQLAQSESPEDVVRKLIGKVYFGSQDGQFSPDTQLADRLQLSFIRAHSKSLKETQNDTTAQEKSGEANLAPPKLTSILGGVQLGVKRSKESRRSVEVEREYNLSAAVGDFEAVLHLLAKPESDKTGRFRSLWPFGKQEKKTKHTRILFVFDQIDNLNGIQALSPLFSLPNSSFIILGGITLKDQIAAAKDEGRAVLDSFHEEYLECQWNQAERILSLLISEDDFGSRRFSEFRDYLNFCAQGLPRRLFGAIDRHTSLVNNVFYLRLSEQDLLRVRLGSKLHRVIWRNRKRILGEYIDNVQYYLRDKALRGTYHLADRMFRVATFTMQDADTVVTQMSDAIVHSERQRVLRNLLNVCVEEGLIVANGNNYALADNILSWVKKIPDWLKDGFVDAQSFLQDLTAFGEKGVESTGVVTVVPRHQPAHKEPDSGIAVSGRDSHLTGRKIGNRYALLKKLGEGGMGEVYLADDLFLKRRVAVKILHKHIGSLPETRSRFLREGQAVARLQHPNIVAIFDFQELPTGQMALVSEYVEGESLENRIQSKLSLEGALNIAIEIATALRVAHAQGVVHRDIKPSNVLITAQGHVKLLDFGIAKVRDEELDAVTRTGELIGTPAYMSPEQVLGEPIDARADIYSLGVVLYRMMTGRNRFDEGGGPVAFVFKVVHSRPEPPSIHNPLIPSNLDKIVMKCLESKPENRYASAEELINALENARHTLLKRSS